MKRDLRALIPLLAAALVAAGAGEVVMAVTTGSQVACKGVSGKPSAFEAAKLFWECNATDDDLGVQGSFDAEAYAELCVFDPNGG